jgi:hypothetical protein
VDLYRIQAPIAAVQQFLEGSFSNKKLGRSVAGQPSVLQLNSVGLQRTRRMIRGEAGGAMGYDNSAPAKKVLLALLPALLLLAWPPAVARADGCNLTLLNSVPLTIDGNATWVTASVGDKEKQFQIDTAAPDNQMGKEAMREFGLHAVDFTPARNGGSAGAFNLGQPALTNINGAALGRTSGSMIGGGAGGNAIPIYDARGNVFHSMAEADRFTLGSMQTDHLQFVITDHPQPGSGGILSARFFEKYDIDLNLAAHRFNMFAPGHCKGQVVYWRAPSVAKLPFRFKDGRIIVRVTLDGREVDAAIDTGSPRSEMQVDDVDSNLGHSFGVLSFGDVSITQPHLVLTHSAASGLNSGPQTGTLLRNTGNTTIQPDLTIGTDLLKLLHVYISFNEHMVYVTQGPELPVGDATAMPVVAVTPTRP